MRVWGLRRASLCGDGLGGGVVGLRARSIQHGISAPGRLHSRLRSCGTVLPSREVVFNPTTDVNLGRWRDQDSDPDLGWGRRPVGRRLLGRTHPRRQTAVLLWVALSCNGAPPTANHGAGPVGVWVSFAGDPCTEVGAGGVVDVVAVTDLGVVVSIVAEGYRVTSLTAGRVQIEPGRELVPPSGAALEARVRSRGEPLPGDCAAGVWGPL